MKRKSENKVQDVGHPRDYPIFCPRPNECPFELLGLEPSSSVDLNDIRVAKHGENVIAAYRFHRLSDFRYELASIAVRKAYRHQGLGSWLLAHVVGIVESKGGREVLIRAKPCSFFTRAGFRPCGQNELLFSVTAD